MQHRDGGAVVAAAALRYQLLGIKKANRRMLTAEWDWDELYGLRYAD